MNLSSYRELFVSDEAFNKFCASLKFKIEQTATVQVTAGERVVGMIVSPTVALDLMLAKLRQQIIDKPSQLFLLANLVDGASNQWESFVYALRTMVGVQALTIRIDEKEKIVWVNNPSNIYTVFVFNPDGSFKETA